MTAPRDHADTAALCVTLVLLAALCVLGISTGAFRSCVEAYVGGAPETHVPAGVRP